MSAGTVGAAVGAGGFPTAAPDEAWHEWRSHGIGASEIAGVLGLSPWSSPWSVWASKVGLGRDEQPDDDRFEFGRRAEGFLAEWFTDRAGLHVVGEQTWCANPDRPWMRATVDGFVAESPHSALSDVLGVWECKTHSGAPWDEIPAQYQCQVQWQLAVTGLDHAWLPVLHLSHGYPRFVIYELERDESDIALLVERAERFWHDHVLAGVAPPTDASAATTAALRDAWAPTERAVVELDEDQAEALGQLVELRKARKALDDELTEVENYVRAALGEATDGHVAGALAVSWRPQDRRGLDVKALTKAHPDIAEQFATVTTSRVLRLHEPKEVRR